MPPSKLHVKLQRFLTLNTSYYVLRRTPTIVYSMERTGSVAVRNSLSACRVFTLATHKLSLEGVPPRRLSNTSLWIRRHIIAPGKRARIISLVRNPIENILSVFARSKAFMSYDGDVAQWFVEDYLANKRYMEHLTWFDAEFKSVLGVDVFDHPFDTEAGFGHFRDGAYEFLILRTELDDERKSEIIGNLIGRPGFSMVRADTIGDGARVPGTPGEQAEYGDRYKVLKRSVKIPDEYWEAIVSERSVRHFISERELSESRDRYCG